MISVMNFLAAGIYQVMAYLFYRPWMITVAHFAWIHIHGKLQMAKKAYKILL
jgi:hypothetical protein